MSAGIPVLSYNADGLVSKTGVAGHRHQPAGLRRPGAVHLRPAARGADQVADPDAGRRGHLHRDPRDGRTSSPATTAPTRCSTPAGLHGGRDRDQHGHRPRYWRTRRRTCSRTRASRARSPWTRPRPRSSAQALTETGLSSLPNGGFDTVPQTLTNITAGQTDFTIYQDPYLQGFLPTLYLYLYNISGGTIDPVRHRHRPVLHHEDQPDPSTTWPAGTRARPPRRSTCRGPPARSATRRRPPAPDATPGRALG